MSNRGRNFAFIAFIIFIVVFTIKVAVFVHNTSKIENPSSKVISLNTIITEKEKEEDNTNVIVVDEEFIYGFSKIEFENMTTDIIKYLRSNDYSFYSLCMPNENIITLNICQNDNIIDSDNILEIRNGIQNIINQYNENIDIHLLIISTKDPEFVLFFI